MNEIVTEFKSESAELFAQMGEILDQLENHQVEVVALEKVGQLVDRILGAAKTLAIGSPYQLGLEKIGDYALLCKTVSYKGSQISNNANLINIIVALLQDMLELMAEMVRTFDCHQQKVQDQAEQETLFTRLQWISEQFGKELRSSVAIHGQTGSKQNNFIDPGQLDKLIKSIKNK